MTTVSGDVPVPKLLKCQHMTPFKMVHGEPLASDLFTPVPTP